MLGSNGSERDAHDRVRTCCVNTKFFLFAVEFVREGEVDTVGLADPVFLHAADLFGPALKLVEVFQEFFGVLSNSEVIAGALTFFNDSAASPAASFDHLFVRQNGVVDRVPVHCLGLAVGNAFLKHFQEHPLIPAVVVRFAGRDFTGPVKSQTESSIWAFMSAMLSYVHLAGATFLAMAAFSAGRPKESQPIGVMTFMPRIRR